ncbi:helix-turn-helix transcriptional regulator [Catenulispora sp. NF23]|uniref:Helix-turn-helix transcriptional regulator n=1 Tax=Catenulispora pinistramenti TaxID=2705254 RepID=A0ABS5L4J3_9ACTN|nr:helix-turn-helix transcriptional regulator [Catenulispora pinistramenti]MBS2536976.1 helix-turn-helix transcriptional regulator [Catenulispora pinistramenti]MBS2553261.1 helix-turn-helix transcriptional regulator [Catenulispora pinistramenti]
MEEGDGHAGGFAEAIRAWRQRRGWTQEELSHASGLSTRAIRSLERGRTQKPRRTTVQMLADALQVPRARLMGTVRRAVGEAEDEAENGAERETGSGADTADSETPPTGAGRTAAGDGPMAEQLAAERALNALLRVPRELPPDLADHELDVREVVAELVAGPTEPYRAAIVRVTASEVAIRAAHHASAKYSDGQLFASLAGIPAVAPAAVLRRFLRSLDADRPAEATLDELAAAFRSALAGHRMLVVLVDAQAEAQIRPLVPAEARCALLVAFGPHRAMGPELL